MFKISCLRLWNSVLRYLSSSAHTLITAFLIFSLKVSILSRLFWKYKAFPCDFPYPLQTPRTLPHHFPSAICCSKASYCQHCQQLFLLLPEVQKNKSDIISSHLFYLMKLRIQNTSISIQIWFLPLADCSKTLPSVALRQTWDAYAWEEKFLYWNPQLTIHRHNYFIQDTSALGQWRKVLPVEQITKEQSASYSQLKYSCSYIHRHTELMMPGRLVFCTASSSKANAAAVAVTEPKALRRKHLEWRESQVRSPLVRESCRTCS